MNQQNKVRDDSYILSYNVKVKHQLKAMYFDNMEVSLLSEFLNKIHYLYSIISPMQMSPMSLSFNQ